MRTEHFNRIMSRLDALSPAQLDELAKAVDDRRASVASYQAIDTAPRRSVLPALRQPRSRSLRSSARTSAVSL